MALFGWDSPKQAASYARKANRLQLTAGAVQLVMPSENGNEPTVSHRKGHVGSHHDQRLEFGCLFEGVVPRGGLPQSSKIKRLETGATAKLPAVFQGFPCRGVPPADDADQAVSSSTTKACCVRAAIPSRREAASLPVRPQLVSTHRFRRVPPTPAARWEMVSFA